jgi:hypothetical protein
VLASVATTTTTTSVLSLNETVFPTLPVWLRTDLMEGFPKQRPVTSLPQRSIP